MSLDKIIENLPVEIYQTQQIRDLEQIAINQYLIDETQLMARAAQAAFMHLQMLFTNINAIAVFCGPGNNAGDGYYLAKLAKDAGIAVTIYYLVSPDKLQGAAAWAAAEAKNAKVTMHAFDEHVLLENVDVIVDALFGTGLSKSIMGEYAQAITWINHHFVPVLSLDIPSGVCSDTGAVKDIAVVAEFTVTFLGLKSGLFTGDAVDYCGQITYDDLALPAELFLQIEPFAVRLMPEIVADYLMPRAQNSHKGQFGHVVVVGGDFGMAGAVSLVANAVLRVGAGKVTVVTRAEHVAPIVSFRPEVMAISSEHVNWTTLLASADVIVLGSGLGRSDWSQSVYLAATQTDKPLIIDADGLYFLKQYPCKASMILTPHPGEAALLLEQTTQTVQMSRYQALHQLKQQYANADIVLKGAGSLILEDDGIFSVCDRGNAGMATAGMGDILAGMIAGLWAQGFDKFTALELGVLIHAMAGDRVALLQGERGMLATDLLSLLPVFVNPEIEEDDDEDLYH